MWIVIYSKSGTSLHNIFETDDQMEDFCRQHLKEHMDTIKSYNIYDVEEWDLEQLIAKIKEVSKITTFDGIKYIFKAEDAEMIYNLC